MTILMTTTVEEAAEIVGISRTSMVCARMPDGAGGLREEVNEFRTTTSQLLLLAEWLVERQVTLVGTDATGVYWKPVHWGSGSRDRPGVGDQCPAYAQRAGP